MKTVEETYAALKAADHHCLYMDFDAAVSVKVWIVASKDRLNHKGRKTLPVDATEQGLPAGYWDEPIGIEWVLVDAMSVGTSTGGGISVTFCRSGATGWYPRGNCRLPSEDEL